jgi:predicted TIM-barrel fold metal-dependent hydrolase
MSATTTDGILHPAVIDVWMQHPTQQLLQFLAQDTFSPLLRWTGAEIPEQAPDISVTVAAMEAAGVEFGLLSAASAAHREELISNDEVAGWVAAYPDRFAGLAAVDLNRPMDAVRELRRRVNDDGFKGLRVTPYLWEIPPTDRRYYPLFAACVDLGVPFFTQVGHTGPLLPSEVGRPIPYIDQIAIDFPELTIVCGHIGYPWTEEMIAVCRKHENVYIDTSAHVASRFPPELVRYMGSRSGRKKVLFAANYPMLFPAQALDSLDRLGLDEEATSLYLAGNAKRLLGI